MNTQTVTLIAAMIAAITSVSNIFLSNWTATSLERTKLKYMRAEEAKKSLRLAVAEFARELSTATQRIRWLVWIVEQDPDSLSEKDFDSYDADIRAMLPRLFTSQVVVAAHDKNTHDRLMSLARWVYRIDSDIGKSRVAFRRSRPEGIKALQKFARDTRNFVDLLPEELAKVVSTLPSGWVVK
jgi:lipopolysaccharide export LptBFGC system permease protein LptF